MLVRISTIARVAIVAGGLALSACAGDRQGELPMGALNRLTGTARTGSWMSPAAQHGILIYVGLSETVNVYNYPKGTLVGQLALDDVSAMCSDKSGNVWIGNNRRNGSQMVEYAHGATQPTTQLFSYPPQGCSVDATNGDLAVVGYGDGTGKQHLEIYAHAQGLPQTYTSNILNTWDYCSYDSKGDIIVQGNVSTGYGDAGYAELLKGHKQFTAVNITTRYGSGGVQWDGKYFVMAYENDYQLWRYSIENGNATFIDNIDLPIEQPYWFRNFWLTGKTIFASSATEGSGGATIAGYPYPTGSPAEHAFVIGLYPYTMTVSVRPKTS
jgi:hypothetical protein